MVWHLTVLIIMLLPRGPAAGVFLIDKRLARQCFREPACGLKVALEACNGAIC